MQMLGHNCYLKVFDRKVFSELDDILNARPFSYTKDTAMDIFMLGYIYGKRAERKRKKR